MDVYFIQYEKFNYFKDETMKWISNIKIYVLLREDIMICNLVTTTVTF